MLRVIVLATVFLLVAAAAPSFAQGSMQRGLFSAGTPQEEAACRRDVRKFCRHVKAGAGNDAFLRCLQQNRSKLSNACGDVLRSHGV
jgi:hypothetical protein